MAWPHRAAFHLRRSRPSDAPVRRLGESGHKTYIADVLVRRPAPSLPHTHADDKAPKLEPVLAERVFEHVLDVVRKQCLHIEQNPRTYAAMAEEDRRNVILSALTTHYDGFTAETDNQGGHTDILARQDGRNVFICECKFWSGQEASTTPSTSSSATPAGATRSWRS